MIETTIGEVNRRFGKVLCLLPDDTACLVLPDGDLMIAQPPSRFDLGGRTRMRIAEIFSAEAKVPVSDTWRTCMHAVEDMHRGPSPKVRTLGDDMRDLFFALWESAKTRSRR